MPHRFGDIEFVEVVSQPKRHLPAAGTEPLHTQKAVARTVFEQGWRVNVADS